MLPPQSPHKMCWKRHPLLHCLHCYRPLSSLVTSVPTNITRTNWANELDNAQWNAHSVALPQHTVLSSHKAVVQNVTLVAAAHLTSKNGQLTSEIILVEWNQTWMAVAIVAMAMISAFLTVSYWRRMQWILSVSGRIAKNFIAGNAKKRSLSRR